MNGYLRVAALVPSVRVADFSYNAEQIISLMARADGAGVEVACFPELCLTAYTCQSNVANHLSRLFYERQGLHVDQMAMECGGAQDGELLLMTCRYCLKNELGWCRKHGGVPVQAVELCY